ncbi:MAG: response regulator [Cyanobacteria bacterium SZAS TMP-1]|nr:response regulator [Cyanobacteria bacterium SZAS TMP-1]
MNNQSKPENSLPGDSESHEQSLLRELQRLKRSSARDRELLQLIVNSGEGFNWLIDNSEKIHFLTQISALESGIDWGRIKAAGWLSLVPESDRLRNQILWADHMSCNQPFEMELPIERVDKSTSWFLLRATPTTQPLADMAKWIGTCRNIDLEKKNATKLEAALKTRSEFIAHISHELRTPLNGILPMIEVILRGELTDETRGHALTLKEAGNSLLNVINNVLEFSKIEAGKIQLTASEFDLSTLVESAAQILAPAAAAKNVLLSVSIDRNLPAQITGDPQRLRQVLLNLCGNAIKFTDSGFVRLDVQHSKTTAPYGDIKFSVIDSGPGIDKGLEAHLFEPFFQGSGETFRSDAGTGLGLSISKHMVTMMGGQMFLQSEPGQGSTFGFSIPCSHSPKNEITTIWDSQESTKLATTVLTFEPQQRGCNAIAESLRRFGATVQSTSDSARVMESLAADGRKVETIKSIVVLDLVRFKQESLELKNKILQSPLAAAVNFIEVTAEAKAEEAEPAEIGSGTTTLAMPLRRQNIQNCFDSILKPGGAGRKQKTRSHSSTMQLDEVAQALSLHTESLTGGKRWVLVADDHAINRQVAYLFLSDLGFSVDLANDGVEAVQFFKTKRYDLVFLDCQMPRIDGFSAAKIIKEIQARMGRSVPVIAMTANAVEGTREECLAHDMDDYVSKPVDPAYLQKVVENWLGRQTPKTAFAKTQSGSNWPEYSTNYSQMNLNKLREKFSETQVVQILNIFMENIPQEIKQLHTLFAAGDFKNFERKLISMRSSFLTLEAHPLASLCADLTSAIQRQDIPLVKEKLHLLDRAVGQLNLDLNHAQADRSTITLPTVTTHP